MATIVLEDMLFKSYIGLHDFEQAHGNRFEVTLTVESDAIISQNDQITETLDYGVLYNICREVMAGRYQLIETAAQQIVLGTRNFIGNSGNITVRICKLNPPLGGDIKKVCIEIKDVGTKI